MKRFVGLAIGVFALFSLLIVQFYRLQILQHEQWAALAEKQHVGLLYEPFARGTFWSNTSVKKGHPPKQQPLVCDIPKWHLHLDPLSIPQEHKEALAIELEKILGIDTRQEMGKKSRNRRVAMWLDRPTYDQVLERWFAFAKEHHIARNALFFDKDYQRSYPFGPLLGQALHTIRDFKDEQTQQGIPTGGLEAYFNSYLQGKRGKRLRERTPRHPLDLGKVIVEPENGADITLTINHVLQAIAEEEVEKGVQTCGAKAGWAIVMEPKTGQILALAQYPAFYPERYRDYFNDPKLAPHALVQGITFAFEPGSPMKAITVAIALKANQELLGMGKSPLFSPDEKIPTRDGRLPGRSKPLTDVKAHSYLNLNMAIQKSSNIYMARLMQRIIEKMGDHWYYEQLKTCFGFGEPTGVELPGESSGFLPKIQGHYSGGRPHWSKATPYSLAMGYNLLVNSFQMLRAFNVIASGGYLVEPRLVRQITKGEEVLFDLDTYLAAHPPQKKIDPKICARVVEGMQYSTQSGGTARRANIPGFTEAGKTGTSEKIVNGQYSKTVHFTNFIGFVPAKLPELVILVAMDEPEYKFIPGVGSRHHGGGCAAPVFCEIGRRCCAYLGIKPDDPDETHWKEEVAHLQEIYKAWNDPHSS
ncbi:MAG: penicillin-binding protein 2 [Verrucomicrobia bacterium]|nr:penicillin-binding protein 2 [Verrucomicrobiota bacterium]